MATFDTKKKDFDLVVVLEAFQQCRQSDDTLMLREYLTAFTELCRFFKLTGALFGFVARDLEDKIRMLNEHLTADEVHYVSVQSMIQYEVDHDLTKVIKGNLKSGSRTLLRLHRALEFILAFMSRLRTGDENEKSSVIASEIYNQTLARFNIWILRKMAGMAMYMLPSKKNLIDVMCKQDYESVMRTLGEVVTSGQPLYDITQKVYEDNDILDLP
ncbi:ceramide-1-phosphate transfer protein-like [Haliotis rufescens]|uniref:ceramide-1-phosphate transfer protein-like n=1 Tax=Haliotis rufescens TaxID=6454 RepID=UPI00201EB927|nr:ceramide-1-phosphate transfer protein-like [Haliotis rufescens]